MQTNTFLIKHNKQQDFFINMLELCPHNWSFSREDNNLTLQHTPLFISQTVPAFSNLKAGPVTRIASGDYNIHIKQNG